ncbi:hypothetical protein [Propionicimonas sp.]|uniref:hypothetical protein n=1 Tax=Propionicimonas sp. TaxID=1955623 RepID=UPI0039E3CACC
MIPLTRILLVALVTCTACAAPATVPTSPAPVVSSVSSAGPTAASERIPAGASWQRTITAADAKRSNVPYAPEDMEFAPDGTLTTILKFGESAWTQFANYGGGSMQPGDAGTYRYDEEGHLLLTTSSDGSTARFAWTVSRDTLTLRMLGVPSVSAGELAVARMMTEGAYRRTDS